jgi:hypothetical protein
MTLLRRNMPEYAYFRESAQVCGFQRVGGAGRFSVNAFQKFYQDFTGCCAGAAAA